jgi:hypothetical protein
MTTETIQRLRQKIVERKMAGEDYSELSRQLIKERAKEKVEKEIADLDVVANKRKEWNRQSDRVKNRRTDQDKAIDHFLELRDTVIEPLKESIDRARSNDLIKAQNDCYEQYHDPFAFGAAVGSIPKGYLPEDFTCPILVMADGKTPAYDRAAEALWYMQAAYGFLANLVKGEMTAFQREVDDGVGYSTEPETEAGNCIVCRHSYVETINNLLRQGKPLRDIESEFDVSRSSLSRHKNLCMNLGAVRFTD